LQPTVRVVYDDASRRSIMKVHAHSPIVPELTTL